MSNPTPSNIFGAVANSLSNPVVLTEEQKIFQEALENAKQTKQHLGSIPAFFASLQTAKTAPDIFRVLQSERARNIIWQEQHGRKWIRGLNKLASAIIACKPLVDQLAQIASTIAAPIWGGVAFILGVIKDFFTTEEVLNQVRIRLEASMKRFQDYYRPGQAAQRTLRSALLQYYERIIIFVVDLQTEFAHGWAVSVLKTVDRSVKEAVELFNREVKDLIENVDWAACARSHTEAHEHHAELVRMIGNIQIQPTFAGALAQPASSTRSFTYGIPNMLSSTFTGRTQDLQKIRASLMQNPQGLAQVAIFGLGGVGKTQILLKYAKVHSVDTAVGKAYNAILYFNAGSAVDVLRGITSFWSMLRPNISFAQQDPTLVADFHKWLRAQENWLLIFDNVENLDSIRDFLPPTSDVGHIIFATRYELLASHLTSNSDPVGIDPMDDPTAIELAQSLAQRSGRPGDKTIEIATRVAGFAKGLPLAIEQVIHNSILSQRSIVETLFLVERNTKAILEQPNLSSLRGPNSSLGAIVMQQMKDLGSRDREAEALFKILVHWSASSVPIQMISDGAGKLPVYLERSFTFDRGQITRTRNTDIDRIDLPSKPAKFRLFDEDPFSFDTWRKFCHIKGHQSKYSDLDLPLDDTQFDVVLRSACSDSQPIGRLFKNEDTILHAVRMLTGSGIVSKPSASTLWIHDLFAELAQKITEIEEKENKSALAAATLVYLAFPVPTTLALPKRKTICEEYLPHAIQSYQHLKSLKIENNLSLGPELSHIIASMFCTRIFTFGHLPFQGQELKLSQRTELHRQTKRAEAIVYYRSALAGYLASHKRILSTGKVTSLQIVFSTVADECRERQHGYEDRNPHDKLQRYGRSAYWRSVQTSLRLSDLLDQGSYEELEEAITMNTIALSMLEHLFGDDHDDALRARQILFGQLMRVARTEEAYDVAKTGLKNLLGWSEAKQMYCGGKEEHRSFSSSNFGASFCQNVAMCCLELPGKERESIAYFKVYLRYCQNVLGEDLYWSAKPMRDLAKAYEKCGELGASIYWFGRSVLCVLGMLEQEWLPYETGEEGREVWASGLVKSEAFLEDAVGCYEQARKRLGTFSEPSLCKVLGAVDSRIKLWRGDREKNGSPYKERKVEGLEVVFPPDETEEEFEARIQKDAEEWVRNHQLVENTVVEVEEASNQLPEPLGVVPIVVHV